MTKIRPFPALLVATLAALLGAACATPPPAAVDPARITQTAPRPSTLLVSLDGFRPDYLELGITPTLSRIAREGVRARWMTPAYPSLTFPNHYAIATGLVPDHHGLVHNTMLDPVLGGFKLSDRAAVGDGRWWGGEPIWVGAEKAGLPSATLYWPGSEAEIAGRRPTRWFAYTDDTAMPLERRVDTVLGWLGEPGRTRPRIATLYFETVDKQAHSYGPHSPQAHAAVRAVDAALGRLVAGLQARGQLDDVNLVIVSDHGMAESPPGHALAAEDVVGMDEARIVSIGQVVTVVPKPGKADIVERKLLGRHPQFECWRKGELPARWRYGSHPRIPPIVCQMHEGWDLLPRDLAARRPAHMRGSHGYDPALPSMRALFLARGPAFRAGATLAPFPNVDVYPLLAHLIGIRPAPNDGDIASLRPALRDAPP